MNIVLNHENGTRQERSFTDIDEAAKWCLDNHEYGIMLYPEDGEDEWDYKEWQAILDYYA